MWIDSVTIRRSNLEEETHKTLVFAFITNACKTRALKGLNQKMGKIFCTNTNKIFDVALLMSGQGKKHCLGWRTLSMFFIK